MKIAIDASQIIYGTGVSVYTKNLIRSLLRIDRDNRYIILGGSLRRYDELNKKVINIITGKANADKLLYPVPPTFFDVLFNKLGFNIDHIIGKTDVFHSSDWVQPASDSYKVTTIHDLVPVLYPKMSDPKIVEVHKRRLDRVKRLVNAIIVPSAATKIDLSRLGFNETKIHVIPEAVDPDFKKPTSDETQKIKGKYKLKEKYLLAVGTSPRKNLDRIISAFEKIRIDKSLKLAVVGEVKKYHDVRNVVFLGHVPFSDLPKIYSGSEALVYPSLYEGFGLPILEAFKLGVPVLTSNIGCMKELANDAAVLVDPNDTDSITDGMIKLFSKREYYIKAGRSEEKKYTWEQTAKMTLDVYQNH